jgi:hypothetical protein
VLLCAGLAIGTFMTIRDGPGKTGYYFRIITLALRTKVEADTYSHVADTVAVKGENMLQTKIDAHIFYRHDPAEVAGLSAAIIPLAEHIKAVAVGPDRAKIRNILGGGYFRLREAERMRLVLIRATRHARANLADYFPYLRSDIMASAEKLEEAVDLYWEELKHMVDEVFPSR